MHVRRHLFGQMLRRSWELTESNARSMSPILSPVLFLRFVRNLS